MKRIKVCPVCGKPTDFCPVGHSLCYHCGWNCDLEHCKSREERIKRKFQEFRWAFEEHDLRLIFDYEFYWSKFKNGI